MSDADSNEMTERVNDTAVAPADAGAEGAGSAGDATRTTNGAGVEGGEAEYFNEPDVAAALLSMGARQMKMPEDVWARLATAITAESAARAAGESTAAKESPFHGVTAKTLSGGSPAEDATVITLADRVKPRTRFNLIASAAVAAAAAGIWLIGGNHLGGLGDSSQSASAPAVNARMQQATPSAAGADAGTAASLSEIAPSGSAPAGSASADAITGGAQPQAKKMRVATLVNVSGKTYQRGTLISEATALLAASDEQKVPVSDVPETFTAAAKCVDAETSRLSHEEPNTTVTADLGYLDGQPVAVLVEENTADDAGEPKVYVMPGTTSCTAELVQDANK